MYTYVVDISDRHKVYEMASSVAADVGHVTILVNNAGIVSGTRILDIPDEKVIKTFEVNAISHFWVGCVSIRLAIIVPLHSCLDGESVFAGNDRTTARTHHFDRVTGRSFRITHVNRLLRVEVCR